MLVSIVVVASAVYDAPGRQAIGAGLLLLGVPVYYFFKRRRLGPWALGLAPDMDLELPLAPYLYWAKSRQPAAIDLAGSNLLHCTLDDLPGVRDAIELSAPNDNGFAPLVEAIAAHYGVAADRIVSADGCSGANFITIAALAGPGDEVLIEQPGYDPLIGACRLMRANVRAVRTPIRRRLRDRFRPARARRSRRGRGSSSSRTRTTRRAPCSGPRTSRRSGAGWRNAPARWCSSTRSTSTPRCSRRAGRRRQRASPVSAAVHRHQQPDEVVRAGGPAQWLDRRAGRRFAERMRRTRDVIDNANSAPSDRLARLAFSEMPRLAERTRALLSGNLA